MLHTIEVLNIRCSGCASTITKELEKQGFSSIDVDLSCEPRKVTVEVSEDATVALLKLTLKKLGYPVAGEELSFSSSTTLKAKSFVSCAVGKFSSENSTD